MEDTPLKTIPAQFPQKPVKQEEPWHRYLNLDLIVHVLGYTLFHPWTCCILVLCLRAQYTPWTNIEMRIAIAWAMLMCTIGIFGVFNERIAYGRRREVDLSEEVVVITGGVEGLGGILAEAYGMDKVNVAVLDTKKVSDDEAEDKGIIYYECDVGDAAQVEAVTKEIVEDLGAPTILINNAGIFRPKSILDSTAEDVEQVLRTNTVSHFNTLRNFLPHMLREGRGTIVTVSSVLGQLGGANLSTYAASKAALHALHHSLRAEIAQHPQGKEIKTILVSPGQMSTKLFEGVKTPSNFLAPVIAPTDVAKEILRLIERGESGEVAVPLYSKWISLFGVLPAGVQTLVRRWSGVDTAIARAGMLSQKPAEKSG